MEISGHSFSYTYDHSPTVRLYFSQDPQSVIRLDDWEVYDAMREKGFEVETRSFMPGVSRVEVEVEDKDEAKTALQELGQWVFLVGGNATELLT